jgi:diketogulonate reductase-like aldo/keto reductase
MPVLGLSSHKDSCIESYKDAICKAGYRYIAISPDSGTEKAVGDALALSLDQIDRKDMFISCTLSLEHLHDPETSLKSCLQKLQLPFVDLVILNWPENPTQPLHTVWEKLEHLVTLNLTKSIGVQNFTT